MFIQALKFRYDQVATMFNCIIKRLLENIVIIFQV